MNKINLDDFDLETVLEEVLTGVLWKDSDWQWWEDDVSFEKGEWADLSQKIDESFSDFIKRILLYLVEKEKDDAEPLTAINYAIHCQSPSHHIRR